MYGFKNDEHHKSLHCDVYKGSVQEVTIHNQGEEVKLDDKYVMKLEQVVKFEKMLRLSIYFEGQEEVIGNM